MEVSCKLVETFPDWEHDFKLRITTVGGFIQALVAKESEIFFRHEGSVPHTRDIATLSQWLIRECPMKLYLSAFKHKHDMLTIISSLNRDKLEYLHFDCTNANLEVLKSIVEFVSTANSRSMKLKAIGLSYLYFDEGNKTLQQMDRLFKLQYCPAVILRYMSIDIKQIERLDFNNCRKLSFIRSNWKLDVYRVFLDRLKSSRITHFHFGGISTVEACQELIGILPATRIVALKLMVTNSMMNKYETSICEFLKLRQLRYFSMSKSNINMRVIVAVNSSQLKYINFDQFAIPIYPSKCFPDNITLCGFNQSCIEPEFYQRNLKIQNTITKCAYTLFLIKKFRPDSVFRLVDINVLKLIVEKILNSRRELVWLDVLNK